MSTPKHWQKILIPTDFSDDALKAIRQAMLLLQPGMELVLVHVTEPAFDGLRIHTGELHNAVQQAAQKQLEELVEAHFPGHRAQVSTVVQEGRAGEIICGLAESLKVDAIIIATHGITALKHFLLGSVAEKVVRHAPCSVLVAR
ncbi:universal stress protein [Prosthecobacter sp.]|uniref:universal stress protein n=1 Tax=Prosthecobacter sp. TaxID=1965333 RepID=UPI0037845CF1